MARVPFDEEKSTNNTVESYEEWKSRKEAGDFNKWITQGSEENYSESIINFSNNLDTISVEYNKVERLSVSRSDYEIINAVAGGDMTKCSCASVALAYAGQKCGYDVLDFRDGDSRKTRK